MCGKAICQVHGCLLVYEARLEQERDGCTGLTAAWCPIHGLCTCPDREQAMDSEDCPLHMRESTHAAHGGIPQVLADG